MCLSRSPSPPATRLDGEEPAHHPHISGQMSLGYTRDRNVQLFCEDLERYGRGEKPLRLVDRRIGY